MHLTPRIEKALKLASHLHREQVRKDKQQTPYSSHLVSVAWLLSSVTEDEDIIIAGLMHDSLEDVPLYTEERLIADCGERVASIVKHVTEPLNPNLGDDEQLPWLTRKEVYLENLRKGGAESALVSAADKIHNTESFLEDVQEEQELFLRRFHSSSTNKVWLNEQILEILKEKLPEGHPFVARLQEATTQLKETLSSHNS